MTKKEKEFAELAPPKDKITYADKIAGAKKGAMDERKLRGVIRNLILSEMKNRPVKKQGMNETKLRGVIRKLILSEMKRK